MKQNKLLPLLFAGALVAANPSKGNAQVLDEHLYPPSFSRDVRVEGNNGVYSIYVGGKKVYSLSEAPNFKVSVDSRGVVINTSSPSNERVFTWKGLEQMVSQSNSNVVKLPRGEEYRDVVSEGRAYAKAAAAAAAGTSAVAAGREPTVYDLEKEIIGLAEDKDKDRRISYEEF